MAEDGYSQNVSIQFDVISSDQSAVVESISNTMELNGFSYIGTFGIDSKEGSNQILKFGRYLTVKE